ncbi:hypothetical protein SLS60_007303 [Paraconiothyrium brasiliense]|uniref:Dipeptidase n=1 Tax=Paraconiothyrium brasiliense TaxID=300254 RepID=A0ABR3R4Y7_9PLEO
MSNLDVVEDTYKGPRHDGEYERLRVQHELVKANMDGKLVLAPIDLTSSTITVLDSATADGYWLVDLAHSLHPQARLVGTDIASQYFLKADKPANIELHLHNIFEAWPNEYINAFDLVHQRFVLPVCNDAQSLDSIQKLFTCVKPGGYIQLHDGDMETIIEGPDRVAMTEFRDMMGMAWGIMGHNLSPGPKLAHWLREAGAADIQETLVFNECGPHVANQVQSERAISVLLALLDGAHLLLGNIPGFPSVQKLGQLKKDLEHELRTSLTQRYSAALAATERNVNDEALDRLKENGGIIMVTFLPELVSKHDDHQTLQTVVDHMLYIGQRIGFDHIGIGSDYDGMFRSVRGLEDTSRYPQLISEMLRRGISRSNIEKIIGMNIIRVLKEVERLGVGTDKTQPVLEDDLPDMWDDSLRKLISQTYPDAS